MSDDDFHGHVHALFLLVAVVILIEINGQSLYQSIGQVKVIGDLGRDRMAYERAIEEADPQKDFF